jgi:hypothetical protein
MFQVIRTGSPKRYALVAHHFEGPILQRWPSLQIEHFVLELQG